MLLLVHPHRGPLISEQEDPPAVGPVVGQAGGQCHGAVRIDKHQRPRETHQHLFIHLRHPPRLREVGGGSPQRVVPPLDAGGHERSGDQALALLPMRQLHSRSKGQTCKISPQPHPHHIHRPGVHHGVHEIARFEVDDVLGGLRARVPLLDHGLEQVREGRVALRIRRHTADRLDHAVPPVLNPGLDASGKITAQGGGQPLEFGPHVRVGVEDFGGHAVMPR
mmetsp:Transcript_60103/g.161202  ORF Transcript_60103/g.161202 Transcript_60103/m.161202 type:complete len:222 (+) Transcript_60103:1750-2415(+)